MNRPDSISIGGSRSLSGRPHPESLYNNASEVIRESLRLLKEHDEIRLKWREQIERGWLQAQAGELVDGEKAMTGIKERLHRTKKRA